MIFRIVRALAFLPSTYMFDFIKMIRLIECLFTDVVTVVCVFRLVRFNWEKTVVNTIYFPVHVVKKRLQTL